MISIPEKLKFVPPNGEKKILLHSCCAPCSGKIMERLVDANIEFSIFFCNPNIHPRSEYNIRKEENVRFARKKGIPFIDADYNCSEWFERVKGLEWEPERGRRCSMCFDMRFERTAHYAVEHDFKVFASSMGISRWKDLSQVNSSGMKAASRYSGLIYWDYNWRKKGGSRGLYEIAKREEFYKQEYCGCLYSLRDINLWRQQHGKEKIIKGVQRYQYEVPSTNPAILS